MAQPTLQRCELTWVEACAEPDWVRYALTALALGFVGIFLLMPLAVVFRLARNILRRWPKAAAVSF